MVALRVPSTCITIESWLSVLIKQQSVNSIDDVLSPDSAELSTDAWRAGLADRIAEILDRKRSSVQGRERSLAIYTRILTIQYAEEEIRGKEIELVSAFLKSIKSESSEKETVLAVKGMWLPEPRVSMTDWND